MTKLPTEPMVDREVNRMNEEPAPTRAYRYYVLGILIVVYTMNFLDRQILAILAGPIKKELELSDSQLGLMGGLAFATSRTPAPSSSSCAFVRRSLRAACRCWPEGLGCGS